MPPPPSHAPRPHTGHQEANKTPQTRKLQQAVTFCPAGCAPNACGLAETSAASHKCSACLGNLLVDTFTGTCDCPAGAYAASDTAGCVDCPKGSYCPGGTYTGPGVPPANSCPENMTTLGRRSSSIWSCGEAESVGTVAAWVARWRAMVSVRAVRALGCIPIVWPFVCLYTATMGHTVHQAQCGMRDCGCVQWAAACRASRLLVSFESFVSCKKGSP
jgi:hypothetical protein